MLQNLSDASYLVQSIVLGDFYAVRDAIWVHIASEKSDVNEADCLNRSPLHAAAYFKQEAIAEVLISAGARVNCKDSNWFTPLHLACYSGHRKTVQVLLKHNADVNARDRAWHTPLHVAAANNSLDCVEAISSYITNINVTDRDGCTSLHHAAYNNLPMMAQTLINYGCAVNSCDKRYRRPLHWAVQCNESVVPKVLLESGADVNARDKNLFTPLHVCGNNIDHARLLLESGAEIDAKTANGNTPLHMACANGHVDVVRELLNYNAPLDDTNNKGETPLLVCVGSVEDEECIKLLLISGADANLGSLSGQTPLHRAVACGRFARAADILQYGTDVDVNFVDGSGRSALHLAALKGHDLLCSTLLGLGADAQSRDKAGQSVLHKSCQAKSVECCRLFINVKVDLNIQDLQGRTALHFAASTGAMDCLEILVSNDAEVNIKDTFGRTPLHYAAANGLMDAVFTLLFFDADSAVVDNLNCLALHYAMSGDLSGKTAEYLLKKCETDINAEDVNGRSLLHYATKAGNLACVSLLVSTPGLIVPRGDSCPLKLAARLGFGDILGLLLPLYHSSESAAVTEDNSIFELAVSNGSDKTILILLNHFKDISPNTLVPALWRAVSVGSSPCAHVLLQHGVPVNETDDDGRTVLFRAVFSDNVELVELLLTHGADIHHQDHAGKTAIHFAAQLGRLRCLISLLQLTSTSDVLTDRDGFSLLHWACHRCHPICVEHLLTSSQGCQWGEQLFSPIHSASTHSNDRCLSLLLTAYGSKACLLRDHKERTPLHIAAICNSIPCIKLLLSKNADVNAVDASGRTPYDLAVSKGFRKASAVLLQGSTNSR